MDETVALGWIIVTGSLGTLLGATVGYYAAQVKQERQYRRVTHKLNNL